MGSKVVTVRVSEAVYEDLRVYADKDGKSISEVARRAINEFLSTSPSEPEPGPGQEELEGRIEELESNYRELKGFVSGMSGRLGKANERIELLMGAIGMSLPEY